jgi:hypothetical protein
MPENYTSKVNQSGPIINQKSELTEISDGVSSPMSEIISRSLVHIQTSKAMSVGHRIGDHETHNLDNTLPFTL